MPQVLKVTTPILIYGIKTKIITEKVFKPNVLQFYTKLFGDILDFK